MKIINQIYGIGLDPFSLNEDENLLSELKFIESLGLDEDQFDSYDHTWRDHLYEYTLDNMISEAIDKYGAEYPAIKYIESFDAVDDEYLGYRFKPQWNLTDEEKTFTEEKIIEAIYLILEPYTLWDKNCIAGNVEYYDINLEI